MRFLSLFAGIGGFDLGLERAGHECVGQVEIDPFCRRVLRARFASVEQQADVRVAAFDDGGSGADLLVGGFPCQDLSVAGKRAGLAGERSGLFWEIVRIAKIIKPPWGLFENVPGLLSSERGADMWTVLAGLRECWPVVGYRILDSRYFGVAQRRRRVFFVCGPTEAGVRAVLFEPEGGEGHPAAVGEAGQGVAASLMSGVGAASNDPGRRREDDVNLEHAVYGWNKSSSQTMSVRDDCPPLNASPQSNPAVGVRRLSPLECERLQGFPDGFSCLCQPMEAYAEDADEAAMRCKCPDSPRYRALGNAVTVSVIEWIGRRLCG